MPDFHVIPLSSSRDRQRVIAHNPDRCELSPGSHSPVARRRQQQIGLSHVPAEVNRVDVIDLSQCKKLPALEQNPCGLHLSQPVRVCLEELQNLPGLHDLELVRHDGETRVRVVAVQDALAFELTRLFLFPHKQRLCGFDCEVHPCGLGPGVQVRPGG